MAAYKSADGASNSILHQLTDADYGLLEPHLELIEMPLRMKLEPRKRPVQHVYFVESGMASVVANGQREVEVGIIGREGMSGVSVVHGNGGDVPNETYIQIAGTGRRLRTEDLREAMDGSSTLFRVLLGYAHTFLGQVSQTALANARGSLHQRLARWLLMVNDRVDGDVVPLTHEFLSVMLGVRRSGVTLALQELERIGAISHKRGAICIIDRSALEEIAAHIYARPV